ncbi:gamma carbonic anhydrase family protein [Haloarchaeobius amylolyticus]|uniref:gamma carbonic anhydrase family protein n=1 Tax=Haloarchaeobius amylolyticus TaxID=1198296 RepID=UPI00227165AE|nr:gamma carbonic anhydrase family protein [Haloarchaeobius amylolyticus]
MVDRRHYEFEGEAPRIHDSAFVARDATLVGDVTVEADASVWPGVVLRGDIGPVRIGESSHVGDTAVLHDSRIQERVMIGHGAVLNDADVATGSLVGINATLNSDVSVGERTIVASGTVVPDGFTIPAESFVRGVPAEVVPLSETTVDPEEIADAYSSGAYTDLASRHEELFE